MSKKGKLTEIVSTIRRQKREETQRKKLWRMPGFLMGQTELKTLLSTTKPPPPNFPAGATVQQKAEILRQDLENFRILSDTPLTWPEESSYNGKPI